MNINNINSTALKTLTGCLMAVVLTIFYAAATYAKHPIDPIVFGEMCVFAATFAGIAYAGFRTQRVTDYGYVQADGEARAKVAAATPSPIHVEAPSTVVAPAVEVAPVPGNGSQDAPRVRSD